VDLELQDLAKTLKNIEEARPFEDLTVVCDGLGIEVGKREMANSMCVFRTRWLLLALISMRRLLNSFLRDAGLYQATRCARLLFLFSGIILTYL
jgi:hypothetical protein